MKEKMTQVRMLRVIFLTNIGSSISQTVLECLSGSGSRVQSQVMGIFRRITGRTKKNRELDCEEEEEVAEEKEGSQPGV